MSVVLAVVWQDSSTRGEEEKTVRRRAKGVFLQRGEGETVACGPPLPVLPLITSVGVPARREDAVLHSLLEAEVDALRAKVAMLESSLTGSQTSYSQLQQDMSQCKREHSLTISSLKEEATRLTLQVQN